jgi:signal transduction histidine kinase
MGILRGLGTFLVGADPQVRPKTRLGRVLPFLAVVLAFALALASFAYLKDNTHLNRPLLLLVAGVTVAPFALLPRYPLMVWRVAWVVAMVTGFTVTVNDKTPWPWHPVQLILLMVGLAAVGLRYRREVLVWTWLSMVVLVATFVDNNNTPGVLVGGSVILVIADQIRRRREAQSKLAVEAERSEVEQARRAVLEERTRIARELHDVVAHHMSLIAVRAETAPYRLDGVPPEVEEEFSAIAGTSREALAEMRRLLGVLRSESPPPMRPQPDLADLAELVRAAREAGVDVHFKMAERLFVPPGVGLTAYRIVQEALSNARRHAAGASVDISLDVLGELLVVRVANGPGVAANPRPDGEPPHGLVGMRERAETLGGTLEYGHTWDGGFAVQATLPIRGAA